MAMGKRKQARQESLFITADQLPRSQGHPFYKQLNQLLGQAGFDPWLENRCQQYYHQEELLRRDRQPTRHRLAVC